MSSTWTHQRCPSCSLKSSCCESCRCKFPGAKCFGSQLVGNPYNECGNHLRFACCSQLHESDTNWWMCTNCVPKNAANALAGLLGFPGGFIYGATKGYQSGDDFIEGKQPRVRPDMAAFVMYVGLLCFNGEKTPFTLKDIRNACKKLPKFQCTLKTSDGKPCPGYDASHGSPANCGYHQTCSGCGTNNHVVKVDCSTFVCQQCSLSKCKRCKRHFLGEGDFCSPKCANSAANAKPKMKKKVYPPYGYLGNPDDEEEIREAWKARRAAVQNDNVC